MRNTKTVTDKKLIEKEPDTHYQPLSTIECYIRHWGLEDRTELCDAVKRHKYLSQLEINFAYYQEGLALTPENFLTILLALEIKPINTDRNRIMQEYVLFVLKDIKERNTNFEPKELFARFFYRLEETEHIINIYKHLQQLNLLNENHGSANLLKVALHEDIRSLDQVIEMAVAVNVFPHQQSLAQEFFNQIVARKNIYNKCTKYEFSCAFTNIKDICMSYISDLSSKFSYEDLTVIWNKLIVPESDLFLTLFSCTNHSELIKVLEDHTIVNIINDGFKIDHNIIRTCLNGLISINDPTLALQEIKRLKALDMLDFLPHKRDVILSMKLTNNSLNVWLPFLAQSNIQSIKIDIDKIYSLETIQQLEAILNKNLNSNLNRDAVQSRYGLKLLCMHTLFYQKPKIAAENAPFDTIDNSVELGSTLCLTDQLQ